MSFHLARGSAAARGLAGDVAGLHQDDVAVVDPVDDLVDVLLEAMGPVDLEPLLHEHSDGIIGGGAESLPDAAVIAQRVVLLGFARLARLALDLLSIQGPAREFEDHAHNALRAVRAVAPGLRRRHLAATDDECHCYCRRWSCRCQGLGAVDKAFAGD